MAAKAKKGLIYKGKPLYRVGNRVYYGNLEDDLILVLDIVESEKFGEGVNYRNAEREDLYKALDIGSWWLQDALEA